MKAFGALSLAALTLALLAGSAQAASPAAVTGSVSNVSTTSVRLNGSVDPNSEATSWYFEFGQTTSYGTKTATQSAGSGANGCCGRMVPSTDGLKPPRRPVAPAAAASCAILRCALVAIS